MDLTVKVLSLYLNCAQNSALKIFSSIRRETRSGNVPVDVQRRI